MFSETAILEQGLDALRVLLPPDWDCRLEDPTEKETDLRAIICAPDGSQAVAQVEVRRRAPLGVIPSLKEKFAQNTQIIPLLMAGWLSALSRTELRRAGINSLDLTGNVDLRLARPGLVVKTTGSDHDPAPLPSTLHSLKGAGAARAVRALADFIPPYGVRQLASWSDASAPVLSRVLTLLEQEGLVERCRGAVTGVAWANLLRRWTEDYHFVRMHRAVPCLEPRGISTLSRKVTELPGRWAATGTMGLPAGTAVAPLQLASIYVESPERAARTLGLKTVESGANVLLVEPSDPGVFSRSARGEDGMIRCAPSQVFADLLTGPGRGSSEAEALLEWMENHPDLWRRHDPS